jgi:phage terminase large subunit-like protein
VVIPSGIVTTAWPRVEAKLRDLGVTFDRWQCDASQLILAKRADGSYAATVGGVCLSIPRQVGKTFLVGMIVVALCLLHPGLTVVWTAHRTRTATKTFQTLKAMTSRPKVAPHMLEPRNANGEQEVRFRNGSVIMFGAREQGFGRGFDKVDIAVFDEAQILSERGVEDIVPATNQAEMDGGALLFFMGTPPRPGDPGEEFTNRRKAAISGETEDAVYIEFSADRGAALDDHKQWMKANPSFPSRTPVASMKRMRANLTDDDSFRREALGIWDVATNEPIPVGHWLRAADNDGAALDLSDKVLAVDMPPERGSASVAACGRRPDGVPQIEVVAAQPGTEWVADKVIAVARRNGIPTVVIDSLSAAKALVPTLEAAGIAVKLTKTADMVIACGALFDAVTADPPGVRHVPHPAMTAAVTGARKRAVGDAWAFDRKRADVDISPLVAGALAFGQVVAGRPQPTNDQILNSFF